MKFCIQKLPARKANAVVTIDPAVNLYYDPLDFDIDDDPYPVWQRMRSEAPLYFNDKYNFIRIVCGAVTVAADSRRPTWPSCPAGSCT